ncbi:YeiH family protein [Acidocella sp.]|uniref:YeiH family protein n=1 Tax=Acidocella sp. TaxID=50710 RepID=UPI0026363D37|nr:putative sulfate exporter family transporter [Acidocella sp.]
MLIVKRIFPGLGLCIAVTGAATLLAVAERAWLGGTWLEPLVLAILLGLVIRAVWTPSQTWRPGIAFAAKQLLEVAVVLLGASVSAGTVMGLGGKALLGIAGAVALSIALSYAIGRGFRLHPRLALLVACGNSICGNSAIAAVAPVIGAEADDVASSIAFTAVLCVAEVLALPLLAAPLGFNMRQYGALAGLTVYAVPQVLAATLPIGALANQVGTLVKLVRVLMLGPVVAVLAIGAARLQGEVRGLPPLKTMLPWFIVGFLALLGARSAGLVPGVALLPIKLLASLLTTVSMAGLGLGVDVRSVSKAGPRVTAAVCLSLVVLLGISIGLIRLLQVG